MQPDDWALLRELRLRSLQLAPEAFGSTYAAEADLDEATWRERTSRTAVATRDGEPAGMVAAAPDGDGLGLFAMWVEPDHRGTGAADALVEWVIDQAAGLPVHLGVAEGNNTALALYQRHGFRPTGESEALRSAPDRCLHRLTRRPV